MPNVLTKKKRSEVMSRVRGRVDRDTEVALVRLTRLAVESFGVLARNVRTVDRLVEKGTWSSLCMWGDNPSTTSLQPESAGHADTSSLWPLAPKAQAAIRWRAEGLMTNVELVRSALAGAAASLELTADRVANLGMADADVVTRIERLSIEAYELQNVALVEP